MQNLSITIKPRFYETDALGHINNASIAAWFEVARVNFLESLGEDDPASTMNWLLASLQIDFVAETYYGTDVIARVTDAAVGNSSLTVNCEMWQGDSLTVRGKATLVQFDQQSRTSVRIGDDLRVKIAGVLRGE